MLVIKSHKIYFTCTTLYKIVISKRIIKSLQTCKVFSISRQIIPLIKDTTTEKSLSHCSKIALLISNILFVSTCMHVAKFVNVNDTQLLAKQCYISAIARYSIDVFIKLHRNTCLLLYDMITLKPLV